MGNEVRTDSRRELLSPIPDIESVVEAECIELPSWRLSIDEFQLPKQSHPSIHPFLCLNPTRRKSIVFLPLNFNSHDRYCLFFFYFFFSFLCVRKRVMDMLNATLPLLDYS